MSSEGCRTDSICCYQDDSGADDLRSIAAGLTAALVVSLLALLAAMVAWRRASGRGGCGARPDKERAGGGTSPAIMGTSVAAAAAAERAPSYSAVVAATADPTRAPGASGKNSGGGEGGEEQRTSTESPEGQRPPLQLAVVEQGRGGGGGNGGRGHILRTPAREAQYCRTNSGVSLRSMKSAGSLNDMQQLIIPDPPSPSSGVRQKDDIQRLRALLDAERSRRVAAEAAAGAGAAASAASRGGGGGGGGGGSGVCTPTSATGPGTPRSRSYWGLHKSAMVRAVEEHAVGPPNTPGGSNRSRDRSGSGGAGEGGPGYGLGAPSRSFGNLANMVATPRRTRLSYSALHKFPSPRTVEAHALEAAENGAKWVQSVVARLSGRGGGDGGGGGGGGAEKERRLSQRERERELLRAELPSIVSSILAHLFVNCRAEVNRQLQARVDGLRAFVGGMETVQLGNPPISSSSAATPGGGGGGRKSSLGAVAAAGAAGVGGGMAPDTQELLYGELRRRHRTIAGLSRQELVTLTARVLSHALGTEAKKEAGRTLVHQTWPSFEPVMRSYLALFVECALQQPPIEFEDTAGTEITFDPESHRELAILPPRMSSGGTPRAIGGPAAAGLPLYNSEEFPGEDGNAFGDGGGGDFEDRTCCIVFPATYANIARWPPSDAAKGGVIVFAG